MSTPALNRLREAYPRAHLALVTPAKLAPLYQGHPAVDLVICGAESAAQMGRLLRRAAFDAALIFPNSFRAAWECFLGRIPLRVGFAGNGRGLLLNRRVPRPSGYRPMRKRKAGQIERLLAEAAHSTVSPSEAHHVHHYLALAAGLGASPDPCPPRVIVSAEEVARFRQQFRVQSPVLGLCPGAEYGPAKRWPPERFAEAAIAITQRTGCGWVLFGIEPLDEVMRTRLVAAMPEKVLDLTGRTSLRELMAGLKLCRVVVTNDSGPMHVAAALGRPVVVPFGSTDPGLTGPGLPGSPGHRILRNPVPCAPCFLRQCPIDHRCMTGIGVEDLVGAVHTQLQLEHGRGEREEA